MYETLGNSTVLFSNGFGHRRSDLIEAYAVKGRAKAQEWTFWHDEGLEWPASESEAGLEFKIPDCAIL